MKKFLLVALLSVFAVTVFAQAPTITSFAPASGFVGSTVTITGTGFNATAANNIVFLGGTRAIVNSASTTSLNITVPSGTTYNPITVFNSVTKLQAASAKPFVTTFLPSNGVISTQDISAKVNFTTGTSPNGVTVGDLDGDGKPDLAVVNYNSNTVSVYRNTSATGSVTTSSFGDKVDFVTGNSPVTVAIGDLDGDGKPDLAVVNTGSNTISLFRNTSVSGSITTASFAAKVDVVTGTQPRSVAIGDLDGDGRPELVSVNPNDNTVSVYQNVSTSGSITLASFAGSVDFATGGSPASVTINDLDGDGKPELAIVNGSGFSVSVFHNTTASGNISATSFDAKVDFTTGANSYPSTMAIGDLDGDGKPDLAVGNATFNTVSVFRNTSVGGTISASSFAGKVDFTTGTTSPKSVTISDFNGDGKPDLAVATPGSNAVALLVNTSASGSITNASFAARVDIPTGGRFADASIGDLDGDGKPDIIVADYNNNVISILRNNPTLPPYIASFAPATGPVGTSVTLTGTGFDATAANNIVFFGAVKATVTSARTTSLSVLVPAGATYQPITVLNATTGLQWASSKLFGSTFMPNKGAITTQDISARVDLITGSNPIGVTIGDLDGDGKPDIALANTSENTVSVYRNISTSGAITNASFSTKVDFVTGSSPSGVAIGDIDGDGKPDLAVVNTGDNTISVLRNTSASGSITASSFAAKVDLTTGLSPVSVAIGDLDGDGKPDLAATNSGASTVSVLRNNSIPGTITITSFAAKVDFTTGTSPRIVLIGDLDGDGKPDLAVANGTTTVSLLRNTASGGAITATSFAAKADIAVGGNFSGMALGDLDGDGKLDLAGVIFSGAVSVLRNTAVYGSLSAASFATKVDFATGSAPTSVAIGDIDGDGKPDLAVANNYGNTISILQNTATSGSITTSSFAAKADFATGSAPTSLAIGDLDGDGKPDLAFVNTGNNTLSVLRNNPQIPLAITSFAPASGPVGTTVTITGTGFNATAANNIVFFGATKATVSATTANSLTVTVPVGATYQPINVLNVTTTKQASSAKPFITTFTPTKGYVSPQDFQSKVDFAAGDHPYTVAISDLDGDGKPDMVVANGTNTTTISVYRNISASGSLTAGSFAAKVDFAAGSNPYGLAIGDIDGDGKPDIAVVNASNANVSVFRNTSVSGTIDATSFAAKVDYGAGMFPYNVAISDLDGDGKPDLAVTNSVSATVSVFRNTSVSGTIDATSFAAKVDYTTGNSPWNLNIGDLDGDGKPDLAVVNQGDNTVSIFRNMAANGTIDATSFAAKVDFGTGNSPRAVAIGDLDGDGKPDLATANAASATVSVLRNVSANGGFTVGSFTSKVDYRTGTSPNSLAIGDIDGDGKVDLAVTGTGTTFYQVSVLRNMAVSGVIDTTSFAAKVDYEIGRSPYSVAIGDLDGDGRPDIATANSGDAGVSVLRNNPILPPTTQATAVIITNTKATTSTISWTNGSGTARAVFLLAGTTGSPAPIVNTTYTANATFGTGAQIGTSGWFNVYAGTGTTVNVSGLASTTTYRVMVIEYNGIAGGEQYLTTTATGNPTNFTTLSNVTTLSNLVPSAGTLAPSFTSGTITYTDSVTNATNSIKVTPTVTQANATVTVNGVAVNSGSASQGITLNVGSNTITTTITAQDGITTQSYTLTVIRAPSSIASLSNLTLGAGTLSPAFSSATTSYTASVSNSTTSITVTPTVTDSTSIVQVNGIRSISGSPSNPVLLNVGSNIIRVTGIAQDGTTTKPYTVTVTRATSAVATLSGLFISAGTVTPTVTNGITNYTASVSNTTASTGVIPIPTDQYASVSVNGIPTPPGVYPNIALNFGSNTIGITVLAQDGVTFQNYTLTVTRVLSQVATLRNIALSAGTLTPAFASATASYASDVSNATTSLTLTPTVTQANATVTVNGTTVASGSASQAIALNVGSNTFTTVVTAQDGTTTKTYTVIVTRPPSAVATLSNLALSAGTLSPVFASGTTNYTANVSNTMTSITATPTVTENTATIKVNGAVVASGVISAPIPLNVGSNTITTTVTAQDGTTVQTYIVTVTRAPSAIATLSNLALSAGTLSPTFASGTTNYTANVSNTTTSITATPTVTDNTATVKVNGTTVASGLASQAIPLNVGSNTITTTVTAQDGTTTQTYTVTVSRAPSAVATLSNLALSAGTLSPTFASATTNYTASVSNTTTSITATPTVTDNTATVKVNGNTVASGLASQAIPLNVGSNTITTTVTAQDGTTTQTYTVTVSRAPSAVATLSNLALSAGTLSPTFASGTTNYTANVSNTTTSITATPTVTDNTATVKVNGNTVASGLASQAIPLNVGTNVITIIVTAQDGTTIQTYTVTVTRAPSAVATLSNLALSSGALSPTFASGTTSYTANVSNTTTSITSTPTTTDNTSTIKVNGTTVSNGLTSQAILLNVGSNTITTTVTAQDGTTTQTYTVTVTRAPNAVATLSNLALSAGTLSPVFASGTTNYIASVGNTITSIILTPTITDNTATIKVNGNTVASGLASQAIPLNVGSNTITTTVTAQDGTTIQTYTVTVTRAPSAVATLSNLALSAGTLSPTFASGIPNYAATVPNATTSITVTPTVTQANSAVTINGSAVSSGSASQSVALNVGSNTITTVVTAQDGTTIQTYRVTVTRAPSAIATLSNFTLSSGSLSPSFAGGTTAYTANVPNATTTISVTPTTTNSNATVKVNGITAVSGAASQTIALSVGNNVINTIVTAQDGTTTQTYTITVTRAQPGASADATLTNIVLSAGTLSPSFSSATTNYTASVSNAISSITLTPTTNQANATVTVNGSAVNSSNTSQGVALNVGSNIITTVVTAQNGTTTQTYSVIVTRAQPAVSTVATLSNLTLSSGTLSPTFASGTMTYTASVPNATTSVTITPVVTQSNATVTVNGSAVNSGSASQSVALNVGSNIITTVVTAQDGTTTQAYTVTLTRAQPGASSDATLGNLVLSSGTLTPTFKSGTTNYTASVSNAISSITITPTTNQANATIIVNGSAVNSSSASQSIALNVGSNTITTVVTAQNGTTTQTYSVIVTRAQPAVSTVATLSNLTLSSGTLSPTFANGATNYTANVPNATTSITLTPTVTQASSTITVNGTIVNSGSASQSIALNVGSNSITTIVTAQDGTTTQAYTVTVTRAQPGASSDAALANLVPSTGTLSPTFKSGTTNYTASVSNAISSITLTPTTNQANATVSVNGIIVTSGVASQGIALNVGINTITAAVTAQDGTTTQTYTVTVTRAQPAVSAIATLSNLTLSSGTLSPTFASGTVNYIASVPNATNSVTITPTVTQANATITVNGTIVNSGIASQSVALSIGINTINTIVTAQDGTTTQAYTVTITRAQPGASSDATLASLVSSTGTLSPTFKSGTTNYTASVSNAISSITITPTTNQANATVTVNGSAVNSGSASQSVALNVGSNIINTIVTAQDGTTIQTYSVTVTRAQPAVSTVAALSSLILSAGTLSPTFAGGTMNYTASVPNATTSVTITPIVTQANATVTVNGSAVYSGSISQNVTLNVGSNILTTIVTAQDGVTTQTYIVNITRASTTAIRSITFTSLPGKVFGNADFAPGASINTGETPVYSSSDNRIATIVNGMIHIVGAGNAVITATTPVNAAYPAIQSATQVLTVDKAQQAITFAPIPDQVKGSTYSLSGVTSSLGAPVTFSTTDATIATVSGTTLNALSIGQATVIADAAGNANYYAAQSILQTVNVLSNDPDNPVIVHQAISPNGDGINDQFQLEGIAEHPNNRVSVYNKTGALIYQTENYDNQNRAFDGHSNYTGALQQAGTYFYVLEYTDKNGKRIHKVGTLVIKY